MQGAVEQRKAAGCHGSNADSGRANTCEKRCEDFQQMGAEAGRDESRKGVANSRRSVARGLGHCQAEVSRPIDLAKSKGLNLKIAQQVAQPNDLKQISGTCFKEACEKPEEHKATCCSCSFCLKNADNKLTECEKNAGKCKEFEIQKEAGLLADTLSKIASRNEKHEVDSLARVLQATSNAKAPRNTSPLNMSLRDTFHLKTIETRDKENITAFTTDFEKIRALLNFSTRVNREKLQLSVENPFFEKMSQNRETIELLPKKLVAPKDMPHHLRGAYAMVLQKKENYFPYLSPDKR